MFKASIDTSLAHSFATWGTHHHLVTTIVADILPYATIAFGILWLALNREIQKSLIYFLLPLGVTLAATAILTHLGSTSSFSYVSGLMGASVSFIRAKNRQAGNGLFWLAAISGCGLVASGRFLPSTVVFEFCLGIVIAIGTRKIIQRLPRV